MLGPTGYLIQFGLGILAFAVLFIKRCVEKPKRPWKVWSLDASKQIFSAALAHIFNLVLSIFMSTESSDECVLYFINTFMDCTCGVLISYIIMKIFDYFSKKKGWKCIKSGLYYEIVEENQKKVVKLNLKMYVTQLVLWLIVTIITKSCLLIIQSLFWKLLENFGEWFLSPYSKNGTLKLVMVMVFFPLLLDALYFWITDNILKLNVNEAESEIQSFYGEMQEEYEGNNNPNNSIELEKEQQVELGTYKD